MTEQPTHRDIASALLNHASTTLDEVPDVIADDPANFIAIAQTQALLAIGHALVDLAKDGINVYDMGGGV
jgi:hypothetical protein